MIRTKGEAGSGNIVEAVRHVRKINKQMRVLTRCGEEELVTEAKNLGAPVSLVKMVAATGKLPVPNFAAGGIATPADAALCLQLGSEAVFVGSGIFKSADPANLRLPRCKLPPITKTPMALARISRRLGKSMPGLDIKTLAPEERFAERGW